MRPHAASQRSLMHPQLGPSTTPMRGMAQRWAQTDLVCCHPALVAIARGDWSTSRRAIESDSDAVATGTAMNDDGCGRG